MTATLGRTFEDMLADLTRQTAEREAWERTPEGRAELEREAAERAARDARIEAKRKAAERAAAIERIVASGINLSAADAERIVDGEVRGTVAVEAVNAWLAVTPGKPRYGVPKARPWDTLMLLGERGVGKTWAAGVALHLVAPCGQYAKVRRLCAIYRAGWGDDAERWESAMRADLLVVDELGTGRDRDLERDMMQELVDERHCRGRATLLISNLSWRTKGERRGLDQVFDARTIDRLENGRTKAFALVGESLRGKR